jgi:hypothetical protein
MVRDDAFFLRAWLRHYGGMFGRENCYIVNHGRGAEVAALAQGCNVIGIPGDPHKNFDVKRWGLLNNIVGGLRRYYKFVIVGDVDELVVVDPDHPRSLPEMLHRTPANRVITPLGLEVLHRVDLEQDPITDQIIGPRRHVRHAPHYSKPCIIGAPTKIARGGHFTQFPDLLAPDPLYLLHLKYCDFAAYSEAMDRRNQVTQSIGATIKETAIGKHWFAEAREDDRAVFDGFAQMRMAESFDMAPLRQKMKNTWAPRGTTGFYHFDRPGKSLQYVLPDRFVGVI